jgi:glycosyltransferase involved in cell wall biosynthesis
MSDGLNVVGTFTGAVGTVVAANFLVEALRRAGVPMAGFDCVTDTHGRAGQVRSTIPMVEKVEDLPYRNTLFLDVIPAVWNKLANHTPFFREQRRAMVFYYELRAIPKDWRPLLATFDILFAPSYFVKDAIEYSVEKPAYLVPVVPIIERPIAARPHDDGPFQIIYSFDPLSAEDRKNPLAGISAFCKAFEGRTDAELLLKIWRTPKLDYSEDSIAKVQSLHPNIRVLQHDISYEENLDLTARADCYLSLHRGEGLGLAMLESMALGTSVISTDYGGVRDFIDGTTGIPVPYHLIETATNHQLFTAEALGEQGLWAEADTTYAAAALQWLVEDRNRGRMLAANARRKYEERLAAFLKIDWLEPFMDPAKSRVAVNLHERTAV